MSAYQECVRRLMWGGTARASHWEMRRVSMQRTVLAIIFAASAPALATAGIFDEATGSYTVSENWAGPIGVPDGSGAFAIIGGGGSGPASAAATYDSATDYTITNNTEEPLRGYLNIGTGGYTGSLLMEGDAGTLTFAGNESAFASFVGTVGGTGTITVNAGTLRYTNAVNSTYAGSGGYLNLANGAGGSDAGFNTGTLNLGGGTVEVGTTLSLGRHSATYTGTEGSRGTVTISSGDLMVGTGTITDDPTNGALQLAFNNQSTNVAPAAAVNLNGGTLSLVRFDPNTHASAALQEINFNGGAVAAFDSRTDFLPSADRLSVNVRNGGAIISTDGFDITVTAALLNGSVGLDGGLEKVGEGALTLGGTTANTYTGLTRLAEGELLLDKTAGVNAIAGEVLLEFGTLTLMNDNQIADSSNVTLDGGAFSTGGFSEAMGLLSLGFSSLLDFDSGASVLSFADSSTAGWAEGEVLTIDNWTGSLSGGGTDQLLVGSGIGGLTSQQLSQIQFSGYQIGALQLIGGEVVPVPEPSMVGSVLVGAVALGWFAAARKRQRTASWKAESRARFTGVGK